MDNDPNEDATRDPATPTPSTPSEPTSAEPNPTESSPIESTLITPIITTASITPTVIEPRPSVQTRISFAPTITSPTESTETTPTQPTPTNLTVTPLTPIIIEPTQVEPTVTSYVPTRHFRATSSPTQSAPTEPNLASSSPTQPTLTSGGPTPTISSASSSTRRSIDDLPAFIAKRRAEQPTHRPSRFILKTNLDDAKNYDFASARPAMKTANVMESIGHLIKSCLGAGVVTAHEAYRSCGIWTALLLSIVLGVACSYCMYILANSAQKLYGRVGVPSMTYPDVAEACLEVGPWRCMRKYHKCFRYLVDLTIAINLFGACCIYQVIMARSLKQLVEGSDVVLDGGKPPLKSYIILLMLPCILICMITTMKYLAPFTVVGDVFIVWLALMMIYYGIKLSPTNPLNLPAFNTIDGLFQFFGICMFSMGGISTTMVIENHMAEPKKFPLVLLGGMTVVVFTIIIIGFFGYWAFGDEVQSPITLNLPWKPFPIMLKVSLILMIYVTYALNFWVPFELIWHYIRLQHAPAQYWFWERIYRAAFVIVLTLVAYLLPNVTYFIAVLGAVCVTNIVIMYPAIINLSLDWSDPGLGYLRWRLGRFIIIFLIGLTLCFGGTYFNMKGLILNVFYKKADYRKLN